MKSQSHLLDTVRKFSLILLVCHVLWPEKSGFVLTTQVTVTPVRGGEEASLMKSSAQLLSSAQLAAAIENVNSQYTPHINGIGSGSGQSKSGKKKQFTTTGLRAARRYTPHKEEEEEFCYTREECGPGSEHWDGLCEEGHRQSPIDIDQRFVTHSPNLGGPLVLNPDYRNLQTFYVMNSGHTVSTMLNLDLSSRATIFLEGAKKLMHSTTYVFAQVHFHWGSHGEIGSEHTLDGQRFAMEGHFVHYSSRYQNLSDAMEHPDGLAVFAVLFEETPKDNPALQPIVNLLGAVRKTRKMVSGSGLVLTSLLPIMSRTPKNAYYYKGSLTTPDCHESVRWVVFEQRLGVSTRQLEAFRSLIDSNGDRMVNNFRPLQSLNGRKIRRISVFCGEHCHDDGTALELYPNRIAKRSSFPFILIGPRIGGQSLSKVELILSFFNISIYIVTICWIISLLYKTNTRIL